MFYQLLLESCGRGGLGKGLINYLALSLQCCSNFLYVLPWESGVRRDFPVVCEGKTLPNRDKSDKASGYAHDAASLIAHRHHWCRTRPGWPGQPTPSSCKQNVRAFGVTTKYPTSRGTQCGPLIRLRSQLETDGLEQFL